MAAPLNQLEAGMAIVYGGDRITKVSEELAALFQTGDKLFVVEETGDLLHVTGDDFQAAKSAVDAAHRAFGKMGAVRDQAITDFFESFAERLEDSEVVEAITSANETDVARATAKGRSTTRLSLIDSMREDMVQGLRMWAATPTERGKVVEHIEHEGWSLEQVISGLGVIAFVFEGRPNVLADACGVLRLGNTAVLRIGSDALDTAKAIMTHAVEPALIDSGLPSGALTLIDSRSHGSGWALFSDSRLSLAVARGSGNAVTQLGAVARQSGVPLSMHGTGGAWIVASENADALRFHSAVYNSLDRKVCNTLNTLCIVESRAADLVPVFLDALEKASSRRGANPKLHVTESVRAFVPDRWFAETTVMRSTGNATEPMTEVIDGDSLGMEWEWENSPEVTVTLVPDVESAIELFNEQSPRFVASLISESDEEHSAFFDLIDAPFVGDGFTRWVDGQYALNRPELGLSNWQYGRLFGRGGILSGNSAFTIRSRVKQDLIDLGR